MNITISPDFEQMTITSELFNNDSDTGTFFWKRNCEETEHSLDITSKLVSADGEIIINASELFTGKTVFSDGVYSIRVVVNGFGTVIVDDVETIVEGDYESTYCIFIGTTSNCKAVSAYLETNDKVLEYLIKALHLLNDCDCDCDNACDLYDALIDRLNNPKTDDNKDCGCS